MSQVARLAKSDCRREEFYAQTIDALVRGLKAAGAAVWVRAVGERPRLACQVFPSDGWPAGAQAQRSGLIELVLETGQAGILPPGCPPQADHRAVNPTRYLLIVCPWALDGQVAGVLEVLQYPGASVDVQTGYVKYLEAIGELIGQQERSRQICELRDHVRDERRMDQLCMVIHGSIDLRATAYAIANEGRQFLNCDRLSVLATRDGRFRLLSVSGVDAFHHRARAVGLVEQLCRAVATMGEPLWHPETAAQRPPQVESLLSDYLDESHARSLAVIPLRVAAKEGAAGPAETIGALVIERFYNGFDDPLRGNQARFGEHAALALRNARELDDLPLAGLMRKARWLGGNRRPLKFIVGLAALVVLAVMLWLVPADLRIAAKGELQPQRMQDVFARSDGVVAEVHVQQGQHVGANELLATLRQPQLDLEFKQIVGELQTSQKRLGAIEAQRVQMPRDTDEQRRQYALLDAQGEELRESIRSLDAQYAILQQKQKDLEVRSPIEGQVLTWDVKQLLAARPVDRGQALMTVGDLAGPWQLEIRLPDRQIAHVLAAQRQLGSRLEVAYVLGTAPAVKLHGTIRQVALRAEVPEGDSPYVQVFVDIDRSELPELVPGASVAATIDCGRHSAGYVWLHDLLDAVRTYFMF